MVSRRNLLKAAAAGTGAMLVPAVLDRTAMAADSPAILAALSYNPPKVQNFLAPNTWTAITPARVTFTAPASGRVLLGLASSVHVSPNGAQGYWRVANAAGGIVGSEQLVTVSLGPLRISSRVLVSGLTPGAAQDWTMQHRVINVGSTITTSAGRAGATDPGFGPLTMVVIAA
jgi:hypothetical protein